ncbi:N-acetylglucosamine kinase [Chelativorans sp. YIM 93263]|uniref:N-acetylglucosamine kinase n=1 Tax=Chelativorans sp. YIM 93263 TaxID=2906648 RepID=UPI0023791E10|nr:BadF/BadG/BcrA/BcrD ATPase family protein [Chelativorans sp. YIM 93263]
MNFLGIDVGGTGSRWALVDATGRLIARGKATGATGHLFRPEARANFSETIAEIAQQVEKPVAAIVAGVTGLGEMTAPEARALIGETTGCPPDTVRATDDIELAFRIHFAPGGGHLVAAGTGSIALHITASGEHIRVGGRGILIDDAGSGAWIALRALSAIYHRIDETGGPADAQRLAEALFSAVGGASWDAVRAFVYGGDRGRIGGLAQAVAKAAQAGDPVAGALLDEAAGELARLANALLSRGGPAPVAFVGGVLTLDPRIKSAILASLPDVAVEFPTLDAALSAARIASQMER